MILLDMNVVSEPMRRRPDRRVQDWLDAQAVETLYLSTISLSELLLGIEGLPVGKRRRALAAALGRQIVSLFEDRIIPFDTAAAEAYAKVVFLLAGTATRSLWPTGRSQPLQPPTTSKSHPATRHRFRPLASL